MAVDLFLPSAVVHALVSDGGAMLGGPPRAVEHITWDAARPDGSLPDFAGLLSFFTGSGKLSAPHLLVDPCSGDRAQFFPANVASRALVHDGGTNPGTGQTNRFGSVCLQTEWRFSPHGRCPVHGVVHTTLFDTPMLGLAEIRAWQAEFGIPQVWAMGGPPTWKSNRNPDVWTSTAGYYSHSQVPWQAPTNHSDPGPMPLLVGEAPVTVPGPAPATISSPDPQPVPHPVAEVDVTVILMNSEGPDQWISDGLRRRHIADVASLQAWQKILKTVVVTPQELANIVDVTPTGAAATVISLADAAKVP